ncbi:uncharacterized protein LOC129754507 [Uranotaenia lowii]|uniref:uncharacterized protein LOC129754507 n=1 Tax=Uranotaenia lowii TaxID=190385 RepID=UPI00247A6DBB|nr:uncharacterized protein LOC129754507 [Uranotaenia lowii]
MDKIEQLLSKQVEIIDRIETFFKLQACKAEILPELINLQHKTSSSFESLNAAKTAIDRFRNNLGPWYVDEIRKVRRNEQLILQLLEHLERVPSNSRNGPLKEQNTNIKQEKMSIPSTVEKMSLADYQKSPFVAKMKPRCLSFLDFNIHISSEDFEHIPKYMRGRESLAELLAFLETTIVSCFEEKYSLLYKNKAAVTNQQDLAMWKTFNQQQHAFPNNKFITEGDIARKMGRLIDKKVNVKLQMLRHLRILQETRNDGTVYYIWIRE